MSNVADQILNDDAPRRGIGDNNPPDPIEILRTHLRETYAPLMKRCDELLAMEGRLPATMDDDWEAKITEAIKSCTKFTRNSETTRLDANEPHRALIAATDGFFKAMSDKVDGLKKKMLGEYLTPYQQKKADDEKKRREAEAAEARRRQEEEQRKAREEAARLAEAKRKEEAAKAEAERLAREAREAEERRAEAARQEAARIERERQEAERREAEAKNKREREAAAKAKAEADRKAAEAKDKADREEAAAKAEADRQAAEAKEAADKAAAERAEQERQAKEQREAADKARADKAKAEKSAGAKAADMSRTRTDLGAVASLRTVWKHRIVDAEKVPRAYLSVNEPSIVAAIRAATTKDGKCPLKIAGVEIYPDTGSVVR